MNSGLRIALVVFVAAVAQLSVVSSLHVFGGAPDLLLVALVCVALLHGPVVGAVAGFAGGLIVDAGTLGTLGVTALLLTLAGYIAGRYGETTGRDRPQAPYLSVAVGTIGVGFASFVLHFLLGEEIAARYALVSTLLPTLVLNVLLTLVVWPLTRWAVGVPRTMQRTREVELVV